jgi:hypothetical protein
VYICVRRADHNYGVVYRAFVLLLIRFDVVWCGVVWYGVVWLRLNIPEKKVL